MIRDLAKAVSVLAAIFFAAIGPAQAQSGSSSSLQSSSPTQAQINAAYGYPATATVAATMYSTTCVAIVNSSTPTSTFCPVATDPTSAAKRTYAAGGLTPGKSFRLEGGGKANVPAGNTLSADIAITVGSSTVASITIPNAPIGNNIGVDFHAVCSVRTTTTISCNGVFSFVVLSGTSVLVPFDQTGNFNPTPANLVDVLGDWNGTTTTHQTSVSQAVLTALN